LCSARTRLDPGAITLTNNREARAHRLRCLDSRKQCFK
jgi:hypothetical protein